MYIHAIEKKWGIDLSSISNQGKAEKRFDFVVKTPTMVYGIETNFYGSSGSKLNETARSYKTITLETKDLTDFTFVWFTDGKDGIVRVEIWKKLLMYLNIYTILMIWRTAL